MGTGHEKQSCFKIKIVLIYLCNAFRTKLYEAALTETVTAHNQGKFVRGEKMEILRNYFKRQLWLCDQKIK